MPNVNELTIMSLNIRSLNKNIDYIRENIGHFNNYDILCFCETSCNIDLLPNGTNDITLDGFYSPIIHNPHRNSNKVGGLAVYVNRRVCDESDIELIDLKLDTTTTYNTSCECMFVKVNIKLANSKNKKSYIIGNFYRSPSISPSHFLEKLDNILSKLDRHRNKQVKRLYW